MLHRVATGREDRRRALERERGARRDRAREDLAPEPSSGRSRLARGAARASSSGSPTKATRSSRRQSSARSCASKRVEPAAALRHRQLQAPLAARRRSRSSRSSSNSPRIASAVTSAAAAAYIERDERVVPDSTSGAFAQWRPEPGPCRMRDGRGRVRFGNARWPDAWDPCQREDSLGSRRGLTP